MLTGQGPRKDPGGRTEATEKCCRPKGAESRTQSRERTQRGEEKEKGADREDAVMERTEKMQ